jgi:hypothetical protein
MEFNQYSKKIEERAKGIWSGVESNFKKFEEKARPRLTTLQEQVDQLLNNELVKKNVNNYKTVAGKWQTEGKQLYTRTSSWIHENYATLYDRFGVATKEEVAVLQKKLGELQKKLNQLARSKNSSKE